MFFLTNLVLTFIYTYDIIAPVANAKWAISSVGRATPF